MYHFFHSSHYNFAVLDKPCEALGSILQSCMQICSYITQYLSIEMVQDSAKVTTECEHEVICSLSVSFKMTLSDP